VGHFVLNSLLTKLLEAWSEGDGEALQELMPFVYDELHRMAKGFARKVLTDYNVLYETKHVLLPTVNMRVRRV
jgi:hypothetical protein